MFWWVVPGFAHHYLLMSVLISSKPGLLPYSAPPPAELKSGKFQLARLSHKLVLLNVCGVSGGCPEVVWKVSGNSLTSPTYIECVTSSPACSSLFPSSSFIVICRLNIHVQCPKSGNVLLHSHHHPRLCHGWKLAPSPYSLGWQAVLVLVEVNSYRTSLHQVSLSREPPREKQSARSWLT